MDVMIDGTRYVPAHDPELVAGRTMRGLRGLCGLTLEDAARAAGCSKSHLHAVEHGKSEPGLMIAVRLADVYGVTLDDVAKAWTKQSNA